MIGCWRNQGGNETNFNPVQNGFSALVLQMFAMLVMLSFSRWFQASLVFTWVETTNKFLFSRPICFGRIFTPAARGSSMVLVGATVVGHVHQSVLRQLCLILYGIED